MFSQFDPKKKEKKEKKGQLENICQQEKQEMQIFSPLNQHLHLEVYFGSQNMRV
jgi:hypothetical protein